VPELRLAVGGEEVVDRAAELGLEQLVGIQHLEPGVASCARRARLPRAHEPDEDEAAL
jgi:hypothetical protein